MVWLAAIVVFGASFAALSVGILAGRPLRHTCAFDGCDGCDDDRSGSGGDANERVACARAGSGLSEQEAPGLAVEEARAVRSP